MYSLYQDISSYIKTGREFSDRILEDLRYNTNKYEVLEKLEKRLNCELKFPDKRILCADNRETLKEYTNKLRARLESQSPILSNLIHSNIEYVKFDGFIHYFNFKSINENTSHLDVDSVIQDIVNEVYSQDLILVINELNRILALERIYSDSVIQKFLLKILNGVYQLVSNNLVSITILSTISIFILNYVYGNIGLFFDSNAQLTISLAISGLTATFVGFGAVFIQLSFDNYKKYYGAYSKKLLFDSIGKEIIYVFIFTNIFAILCAITNEKGCNSNCRRRIVA